MSLTTRPHPTRPHPVKLAQTGTLGEPAAAAERRRHALAVYGPVQDAWNDVLWYGEQARRLAERLAERHPSESASALLRCLDALDARFEAIGRLEAQIHAEIDRQGTHVDWARQSARIDQFLAERARIAEAAETGGGLMDAQRKRLVADRFRRIWQIVEEIAAQPGQSRRDLARTFHLSERQVQADLNIIRSDLRLPLVRRQGYRFIDGEGGGSGLSLYDAQLLLLALRQASQAPELRRADLGRLLVKLPSLFPPHVRPLASRVLAAATDGAAGQSARVVAAVADALLAGRWVRLSYPPDAIEVNDHDPLLRPSLLLPYLSSWYVIGENARGHSRMWRLDAVSAVTVAAVPERSTG